MAENVEIIPAQKTFEFASSVPAEEQDKVVNKWLEEMSKKGQQPMHRIMSIHPIHGTIYVGYVYLNKRKK